MLGIKVDVDFFNIYLPNVDTATKDILVAINELIPLSIDEDGEFPIETATNNKLLQMALEDWLNECYDNRLLSHKEMLDIIYKVRK